MTPDLESLKRQAAEAALEYVQSGMALGLGTGSTAKYLLYGLADRLGDGRLREIVGVPTSERTAALARELGIPLATLAERPQLDLAIDGADEIDPQLELIKGLDDVIPVFRDAMPGEVQNEARLGPPFPVQRAEPGPQSREGSLLVKDELHIVAVPRGEHFSHRARIADRVQKPRNARSIFVDSDNDGDFARGVRHLWLAHFNVAQEGADIAGKGGDVARAAWLPAIRESSGQRPKTHSSKDGRRRLEGQYEPTGSWSRQSRAAEPLAAR